MKQAFYEKFGWTEVEVLPQDGTARTYTRVEKGGKHALVMDIPQDENTMLEYLRIGSYLRDNGVRVPEIYELEAHNGFALIEDFGSLPMRIAVQESAKAQKEIYQKAFVMLEQLKALSDVPPLCVYESNAVHKGRRRVMEWYLPAAQKRTIGADLVDEYLAIWDGIEKTLPPYKRGFVHGDYHVDNIMVLSDGSLGLIDFQDAMFGSPLYDLGNLLEDMRADVPADIQKIAVDKLTEDERAWMRILTTQFHCRLLGQCLLWPIRQNKPQYMRFLPRLEAYVRDALARDPLLLPLKQFFDDLGLDFTLSNDLNIDEVKGFISDEAF